MNHLDTPVVQVASAVVDRHRDLAAKAIASHKACTECESTALMYALDTGEVLNRVKPALPHGTFHLWLAEECPSIAIRTAQQCMLLARHRPTLEAHGLAHLTITTALALLPKRERPATELEAHESVIEGGIYVAREVFDEIREKARLQGRNPREVYGEFRPGDVSPEEWAAAYDIFADALTSSPTAKTDFFLPEVIDLEHAYFTRGDWGWAEIGPSARHPGYVHISCVEDMPDGGAVIDYTKRPIHIDSARLAAAAGIPERFWTAIAAAGWEVRPGEGYESPIERIEAVEAVGA